MRKAISYGCLSFAVLCLPLCKEAQAVQKGKSNMHVEEALRWEIHQHVLSNGLRVVISPDHTMPTVAVNVTYNVGSRDEEQGRSGFAHLFEHMMFQGSKNVPRGKHFELVSSRGGVLNGTTNTDRTNYFETLPSNDLGLALFLEADRMRWLDVSPFNVDNQRAVVKEERRMRVDNVPYVSSWFRLQELVYGSYFPYAHSTIGSMADLDAATLQDVQHFHAMHYSPNNAVIAIVGDVDPHETLTLVKRFFGSIAPKKKEIFHSPRLPTHPPSPQEDTLFDTHAQLINLFYGWVIPPASDPDHYPLSLAGMLLGQGDSSRMYEQLVRNEAIAAEVGAFLGGHEGPDYFALNVKLADPKVPEKIEQGARRHTPQVERVHAWIEKAIQDLAKTPPTQAEMRKLHNKIRSQFFFALQPYSVRAEQLAEYALFRKDAEELLKECKRYARVTPEDISRAVRKYLLTPFNRTVTYPRSSTQ